jgi:hypothetical protein
MKFIRTIFQNAVPASQKVHRVSITNTDRLMVFVDMSLFLPKIARSAYTHYLDKMQSLFNIQADGPRSNRRAVNG